MSEPKYKNLYQTFVNTRHINLDKINKIITQDVFDVLHSYMDIDSSDIVLRLDQDERGDFILRCKVKAKRLKIVGFLS